jgi:cytoskeletal protein CcmA (bactofilin family)
MFPFLIYHELYYIWSPYKKTETMAKENNVINPQVINLISSGTRISGDLISDGDLRIDGEITGNLETKGRLVIGASGRIDGEIKCKSSEISGTHKGKLFVAELLSLKASSNVTGDIVTGKLSIEPGAFFAGTCTMSDDMTGNDSK